MKKAIFMLTIFCGILFAEQVNIGEYLLVEKGKKAPDFSLYDVIKRKKFNTADIKSQKLLLINFFATYCAPCKTEFPGFVKLFDKYGDRFQIMAISLEKDNKKITDFAKEFKLNFPVFMDYTKVCLNQYIKPGTIAALPTNILIGKDGNILEITTTLEEKKLEEWILKYSDKQESEVTK